MPPFPVIVADAGGLLDWLVQQPVYQRGLADTEEPMRTIVVPGERNGSSRSIPRH